MLDDESTTPADESTAAAPAKRAPRKATATKRVPRKAAAKAAAPAAETSDAVSLDAGAPSDDQPAVVPQKAKRTTRARKAAAPAPAAAAETDGVPTLSEIGSDGPATDETPPAAEAAPVKRAPRKRTTKAATKAAATPVEAVEQSADESNAPRRPETAEAAPGDVPPGDEAPAPRSRRRKPPTTPPVVLFQPPSEIAADAVDTDEPADDEPADHEPAGDEVAEPDATEDGGRRRRRRGRRGRGGQSGPAGDEAVDDIVAPESLDEPVELDDDEADHAEAVAEAALSASARRRRRRRRSGASDAVEGATEDDPPNTVVHVRDGRSGRGGSGGSAADADGVRGVKGSTRLEAKRQRRRDNRDTGRRRAPILTEAEFLARREAVDRVMAVRQTGDRTQIAVLEDEILVEHYVTRASAGSAVGNVYLGRVQNVLPSMEAAFVDIGRGRNGVLYAGEVNWDAAGLEGKARAIENAMSSGDTVLVQVTKDPIGQKGARLTSQISLPGRFVVYVPGGAMTGISRKLPDVERARLKAILKKVVPDEAGVIVRTAAEGASESELISDVERLKAQWEAIRTKAANPGNGPSLVYAEPDLAIRVVRDVFNDDFSRLIVSGADIYRTIADYVADVAPDLSDRISRHTSESDLFADLRVDEQLTKALDRKVFLPSGGSLVIDRTEAMVVVDVNTGRYTGSGGNLEQTVTRNNIEAAEEIVRQLRLRDIGGIVVIDFIDMVLESNRELVLRRLTECLGRDRTKHQVAEVTSLGLVQMTRKRVGEGLLEAFSEPCDRCKGRGVIVHTDPVEHKHAAPADDERPARGKRTRKSKSAPEVEPLPPPVDEEKRRAAASAIAAIAAATVHPEDQADSEMVAPVDAIAAVHEVEAAGVEAAVVDSAPPRGRRRRAARRPAGAPTLSTPVGEVAMAAPGS